MSLHCLFSPNPGFMTKTALSFFHCLIFFLAALTARAVELVEGPKAEAAETSAVITWKTDVACGTRAQFGVNAELLNRKVEGAVSVQHSATLEGLKAGTLYHFSVGSARTDLAKGSFTTKGGSATPPPAAAPQPSIMKRVLDAIVPGKKTPSPATETKKVPANPAVKQPPVNAPPTRQTWGSMDSLQDHFERHGPDFQSRSADEYAAQAWQFLQRARAEGLPMKLDETDGTVRVFDPKTRAFAAYNRFGKTKTYFRPDSPGYWQRQPGRLIKPSDFPLQQSR